jgi:ribosomal protein S12 methylthiotransferase accessory factor
MEQPHDAEAIPERLPEQLERDRRGDQDDVPVDLEIQLPPDFPEKYKTAVIRSAEQCAVKKHLEHPPTFNVTTSTTEAVAA